MSISSERTLKKFKQIKHNTTHNTIFLDQGFSFIVCFTIVNLILIAMFRTHTAGLHLPCEPGLHLRGMRWRAKSSLCRQPFNFLSCMRKIRHAIRKQLVRQICVSFAGIKTGKTACEQLSSSFCFVFLLFPLWF